MKRSIAIVLAVLMILSAIALAGCGNDKKISDNAAPTIIGNWEGELDMSSYLDTVLSESGIDIETTFAKIALNLEFKDGNKFTPSIPQDSIDAFINNTTDAIVEVLKEQLIPTGKTLEETIGMSESDFRNLYIQQLQSSITMPEFGEMLYKLDGNKLYFGESQEDIEDAVEDMNYVEIELTADTLSFVKVNSDSEGSAEMTEALLPLTFKRVS